MFELSQLRCFVTVAEELHFGRAAARLHMTQPPLSRQIQLLEHALGVKLLERTSRAVRLTAAGQVFHGDAAAILRQAEQAALMANRVGKGEAGRVTVGFTAVAGYEMIPRLVAGVQQHLPGIDIVLKEMVSKDQLDALAARTIDLGFARPLHADSGLRYHPLSREPLMLAIPASHPYAKRRTIRAADLEREPLVMYSPDEGKYFHELVSGLFAAAGVRPRYVQHISQTHTILALVRGGIGIAVVPASAMSLPFPSIVYKPLWRSDLAAEIHLAWHSEHRNPAVDAIRSFIVKHPLQPATRKRGRGD